MKKIIAAAACIVLLAGCEKEIDIDYRSVEPEYVIEARVTNEKTEVLITRTRDMEDGRKSAGVGGATVELSGSDGYSETLVYDSEKQRYLSPHTGKPGTTYTVKVSLDGQQYTSTSTMPKSITISDMYFQWQKVLKEKMLFSRIEFQDIPDEDNYYCVRIYRNDENEYWDVFDDRGWEGELMTYNTFFIAKEKGEKVKDGEEDVVIFEGDVLSAEVQVIDKRVYDYLYALILSERTSSNPAPHFTGGCLGYFSAYPASQYAVTFRKSQVRD